MEVSCWDEDVGANESLAKIRAQPGGGAAGLAFANKSPPPLRRAPLQETCLCNRGICSKRLEIQHRALRDFPGEGLRRESELRFIESWVSTYFVIGARENVFCNATALQRRGTCCPRSNFVCRLFRNQHRIHEGKSKFARRPGDCGPRPRAVTADGSSFKMATRFGGKLEPGEADPPHTNTARGASQLLARMSPPAKSPAARKALRAGWPCLSLHNRVDLCLNPGRKPPTGPTGKSSRPLRSRTCC